MRRALLALALLSGLALVPEVARAAKATREPAATPAPAAAAAPKPPDPKARTAAFAEYESELASGQKARAADALVNLIEDPARAVFRGDAWAKLGDLLVELRLPYAALCAYVRGFEAADDFNLEEVGSRVPAAIKLATELGDTMVLQRPFSKNLGLARTEDVRGQMAMLAAREQFREGSYGIAQAVLKLVAEGDPLYADAKALEGVILSQQARHEDALTAFEKALAAGRDRDQRFKDLVSLNTARSFYGAGNFPRAIQGYAAVSRASEFWPQAQFERAWAHFRLDDFNGTLALLLPLDTAFFSDWYFPEADLLRIYSMFYLCKFPEASKSIETFTGEYKPLLATLRQVRSQPPAEIFEIVKTFVEKGDPGVLPVRVLRPWAVEDRFLGSLAALKSLDAEIGRLKGADANIFSVRSKSWLEERRAALVDEEGARVAERLKGHEQELADWVGGAELFTVDLLRMKGMLYEQASLTGKMPDVAKAAERQERIRKGWREWPFEGEYWADELGYYRVTAAPECPAALRRDATE